VPIPPQDSGLKSYTTLNVLSDLVLEESWILEVTARHGSLVFTADFVMTADHPDYAPPLPDEVFSYFRGSLVFPGVTELKWPRATQQLTDAVLLSRLSGVLFGGDNYAFGTMTARPRISPAARRS
jgi:hypothetical protein